MIRSSYWIKLIFSSRGEPAESTVLFICSPLFENCTSMCCPSILQNVNSQDCFHSDRLLEISLFGGDLQRLVVF